MKIKNIIKGAVISLLIMALIYQFYPVPKVIEREKQPMLSDHTWSVITYLNRLNLGKVPFTIEVEGGGTIKCIDISYNTENTPIRFIGGLIKRGYLPLKRYDNQITHLEQISSGDTIELYYGIIPGKHPLGLGQVGVYISGRASGGFPFFKTSAFIENLIIPYALIDLPFDYLNMDNTASIALGITSKSAPLENKAIAVYNWIRRNLEYKIDADGRWQSSIETLQLGDGDCEDFATLFYSMMRSLGETPSTVRISINIGMGHAYNEIFYMGEWTVVDVTSYVPPFRQQPFDLNTQLAFSEDYFWSFLPPQTGGLQFQETLSLKEGLPCYEKTAGAVLWGDDLL